MSVLNKNKSQFTVLVDKKLFEKANKARTELGLTWPQLVQGLLTDLVEKTEAVLAFVDGERKAKASNAPRRVKSLDLGF
jgi:hypothetical protein